MSIQLDNKTILIVEDDPIILKINSKIVNSFGYEIVHSSTGEEAIEVISKVNHINLILMDIDLGQGIDGTETAKIILEKHDLPIVFLSSHTEPEIVSKTEKITSYGYIVKGSVNTVLDASIKMAFKLFESKKLEKQGKDKLIESEKRLKLAQASGEIGTWDLDIKNNKLVWDQLMFSLYCLEPKDFSGTFESWTKLIHPEDLPKTTEKFNTSISKNEKFFSEFRIIRPDGIIKFIEAHGLVIFSKTNEPLRVIGINIDITDRMENEINLQENRQRFLKSFEFAPIGMALVSPDGKWLKVNKSICNILGYSEEELLSTNFQNITHPEDLEIDLDFVFKMLSQEIQTYSIEKRYFHKNGNIIHANLNVSLVKDKFEKPQYFISQIIDITESKVAKEKSIQKDKEIKSILTSLNDFIFLFSKDYKFLEVWTNNIEELFLPPEEFIGKTIRDVFGDSFAEPIEDSINKVINSKKVVSHEYSSPDGKNHFLARLHFLNDFNSDEPRISCMVVDITERKNLEIELRKKEKNYKLLLDTLQEGIWVIDNNGITTFTNPRMEKMLGYNTNEMLGKPLFDFMDERGKEIANKNIERRRSGIIEQHEFEFITKKGERVFTIMETGPLTDEEGLYSGVIAGILDITKRKLNEEKIESLLKEKEIILQEVHHRIKNNMSNVIGFLEIGKGTIGDQAAISVLGNTQRRIISMMQLYDKLYRSNDYNNLSLKDYLESLTNQIVQNYPNSIKIEIRKSFSELLIDSKILTSIGIITNEIITNSMKYAFNNLEKGIIDISTTFEKQILILIIKDNGEGISESINLENSTGFGFTLIDMMISQLKGKIRIERNQGTSFEISIPIK